jgi:hypothetical protein
LTTVYEPTRRACSLVHCPCGSSLAEVEYPAMKKYGTGT